MGGSSATAISWSTRRGPSPSAGRGAVGRVEAAAVVGRAAAGHEAKLLSRLRRARESGEEVAIGAATDPYQPAESRFRVTRRVLESVERVPGLRVGITTKSPAVTRDIDLLRLIAAAGELIVNVSL